MKIKINCSNIDAIEKQLSLVNGKARSFCIIDYDHVERVAHEFLTDLRQNGFTVAECSGAVIVYRPCGPSASSYKYKSKSTIIKIQVGANGKDVFLTDVISSGVNPKQSELRLIRVNASSHTSWIKRVSEKFGVISE